MKRMYPSVMAQIGVINRWLIAFGDRRPSEAAMECATMSAGRRRRLFRNLRIAGCIAIVNGQWAAVKGTESAK